MQFPKNFCDIGSKSFEWVYNHKHEFVEHTMRDMKHPTGLFLRWHNFCKEKAEKKTREK